MLFNDDCARVPWQGACLRDGQASRHRPARHARFVDILRGLYAARVFALIVGGVTVRSIKMLTVALALSWPLQGACWSMWSEDQRPPPARDKDIPDCAQFATVRPEVSYPRDELRRRVEGWVALGYKLTGDGTASDIRLVDSEPRDVFVQAAASALQRWRFVEGEVQGTCLQIVIFRVTG